METTFTFRVSQCLASPLSSAEMRSWLEDFLRQPHVLPGDPGPGDARISLTLPRNAVDSVAAHLRCSASSGLRRIAIERLGVVKPLAGSQAPRVPMGGTPLASAGQAAWSPSQLWTEAPNRAQDGPPMDKTLAEWLIPVLIWMLAFGGWLFFNFRKGKRTETT